MKKIIVAFLIAITMIACAGCQAVTRELGGSMTLDLPPDTKLVNITWKEDSLWYLTRPHERWRRDRNIYISAEQQHGCV